MKLAYDIEVAMTIMTKKERKISHDDNYKSRNVAEGISDTSTKRFIDSPPIPLGPNAARASLDVAVLPSALLEGTRNRSQLIA